MGELINISAIWYEKGKGMNLVGAGFVRNFSWDTSDFKRGRLASVG